MALASESIARLRYMGRTAPKQKQPEGLEALKQSRSKWARAGNGGKGHLSTLSAQCRCGSPHSGSPESGCAQTCCVSFRQCECPSRGATHGRRKDVRRHESLGNDVVWPLPNKNRSPLSVPRTSQRASAVSSKIATADGNQYGSAPISSFCQNLPQPPPRLPPRYPPPRPIQ